MKQLSVFLFVLFYAFEVHSQQCAWAYTAGLAPRTLPSAIKQDHQQNNYLASYTRSTTENHSQIEKRNPAQQLLWGKVLGGKIVITDLEINSQNHAVVVGWFEESVTIEGITLTTSPANSNGFMLEYSETGTLLQAVKLDATGMEFKPVDLFIDAQDLLYFTAEISGDHGFCSFHMASKEGQILKSEFNDNFDNRTFSHILVDGDGNVFLSGTCGNQAAFDNLHPDPNDSYQHFVVKYNAQFEAQWLHSRRYITFDDNNELVTDGQHYYWVFDEAPGNYDTVRIVKLNPVGTILKTVDAPMASAFFQRPNFSVDQTGNGVLVFGQYSNYFIFQYDPDLQMIRQDTIPSHFSGNEGIVLESYDSVFYLSAPYMGASLVIDDFTLTNPNTGANYPSDIFVTRWLDHKVITSVKENTKPLFAVFPNPVTEGVLKLQTAEGIEKALFFDITGRNVLETTLQRNSTDVDVSVLKPGLYRMVVYGQGMIKQKATVLIQK